MNILMVLYGDFNTNTARPLVLYAQELQLLGHSCAVAVPFNLETVYQQHSWPSFRPMLYSDVLADPDAVFPDARPADVVHAWTPREIVRRFVTSYMAKRPTPLVMYLEDNELWISCHALGLKPKTLVQQTERCISEALPDALSHPYRYDSFIGLADAVAVIQDKLKIEVPPWVHCVTLLPGVDLQFFSPRPADPVLREKYEAFEGEKIIVYNGGMNEFTRPNIKTLCHAVGLINERGYRCRLLRSGPFALDFLGELPHQAASAIRDLGLLRKHELPGLLALADLFVQPGQIDPFDDLRLPGKLPELLAMGRPVILPDVNIANLFQDGVDALLLRTGSAEEIADKCIYLFDRPAEALNIGRAGRLFAERHFDAVSQTRQLEQVYQDACKSFNLAIAAKVWASGSKDIPLPYLMARKLRLLASSGGRKWGGRGAELLRDRARYIEQMQLRVRALEEIIVEREGNVAQRDAAIAERDGLIAERDRLVGSLQQQIAERSDSVAQLESTVAGLQNRMLELNGQVVELASARDDLLNSTSWRLTMPLRALKRLPSLVKALRSAANLAGGYRALTKIICKTLVREGFAGVKRRVLHVSSPSASSIPDSYCEWVRRYDTLTDVVRASLHKRIDGLSHKPMISIVMPVFNGNPEWLISAIESVRAQIYSRWELCIADDASTDPAIRQLLEQYSLLDPRVKVVFRPQNGHISAASNDALRLATGEWVALLDHDDVLAEHALLFVAEAINKSPDVQLIYSDEDKIDTLGQRCDPYFKTDWNLYLFRSHNMICHLGVYKKVLVDQVGGFREGYEGAQDYDLALRYTELVGSDNIVHIPRVLYHWRIHDYSTAKEGGNKPYALVAGGQAINEHLSRTNTMGRVDVLSFGMYRVRYDIPEPEPLVTLIIPTRNGHELVRQCIDSILTKTTYKKYEIILVDNASNDPISLSYFQELKSIPSVRVVRDERPFNFSALNNSAVSLARGELIGLINNDIEVIAPEWLEEMVGLAIQPGVGAVGARLLYPSNRLQHAGVILGVGGVAGHSHKHLPKESHGYFARASLIQGLSAVTAACLVIKKGIYESVGGLDEENLAVAFNDVDFCLRVREAGYQNVWTPYAELYHHESVTRGHEDTPEKMLRFSREVMYMKARWGELLANDPMYNPNLTLEREDFSLAWPPRVELF